MTPEAVNDPGPTADLPPSPPRWRTFLPSWIRSLIWVDESDHFDAFLSYSWKADGDTAPAIQSILQRFLCPWYRVRALRVFRDLSSLPAGGTVEGALCARLDRSRHLIVLASPEAPRSAGMELEARHWLAGTRRGEVLIIVTSGDFESWHDIRQRLLPPSLAQALQAPPIWADLRGQRASLAGKLRPATRESVVEGLKQIILRFYPGKDWGVLRGEERNARRNALRLLGTAVILLTTAFLTAFYQFTAANASRREAQLRLARSLVSEAYALGRAGRWREARLRIGDSAGMFDALGASRFPAQLAEWYAHSQSPLPLRTFTAHRREIVALRTSGNRTLLSVDGGGMFVTRDMITGDVVASIDLVADDHWGPELLTRDGSTFIVADGGTDTVTAYATADGRQLWSLGELEGVNALVESPSGKRLLIVSNVGPRRVIDLATQRELENLDVDGAPFETAAFLDEDTIVAAAGTGADPESKIYLRSKNRQAPDLQITSVTTMLAGRVFVSGHRDGTIRLWPPSWWQAKEAAPQLVIRGHTGAVTALAFSDNGDRLLSGGADGLVRLWELPSGDLRHSWADHSSAVSTVAFMDATHVASGDRDGSVKVWTLQSGNERRLMACNSSSLEMVGLSLDGRTALVQNDASMTMVVNVETDTALMTILKQQLAVALHPNGRTMAVGNIGDGEIRSLNIGTGQETPLHRVGHVEALVYSGDGARLAVVTSESVRLLVSETGELIAQSANARGINRAAVDRAGTTLLLRDRDGRLQIWKPTKGAPFALTTCKAQSENALALSSDGNLALCAENDGRHLIRIMDTASDEVRGALAGHADAITAVTFAANDRVAITSSRDGTIRFWDLETLGELLAVPGEATTFGVPYPRLDVIAGSSSQVELLNLERSARYAALGAAAGHSSATEPIVVDWTARRRLVEWYALRNECEWARQIVRDLPGGQSADLAMARCGERTPGFGLIKAFGAVPDAVSTEYAKLFPAPFPCVVNRGVTAGSK
jgi:WD40 repeat protein